MLPEYLDAMLDSCHFRLDQSGMNDTRQATTRPTARPLPEGHKFSL